MSAVDAGRCRVPQQEKALRADVVIGPYEGEWVGNTGKKAVGDRLFCVFWVEFLIYMCYDKVCLYG